MKFTTLKYDPVLVRNSVDPTRTTVLRNAFSRKMNQKFDELKMVITKALIEEDVFGLDWNSLFSFQMVTPGSTAFAFTRSSDKIAAFMEWLQEQVKAGILEVSEYQQIGNAIESAWTNLYIEDSYKRGVMRARQELIKSGYDIPSMDETGGIEMAMTNPFHVDRLGLIFTRVYSDLKGITDAMDSQISRVLAQGLADGDGPRLLARKILAVIDGTDAGELGIYDTLGRFIPAARRAELLTRTEIIRAHHQATIQEYMNWRIEGVYVQAEVVTAGDKRVCSKCDALARGGPYTLEQAMNLIPYHPACRCIALPIRIGVDRLINNNKNFWLCQYQYKTRNPQNHLHHLHHHLERKEDYYEN